MLVYQRVSCYVRIISLFLMIEPEQLGLSQIKLDFISGIFDAMLCVNHSLLSETSTQIVLQCLKKSSLFNLYR